MSDKTFSPEEAAVITESVKRSTTIIEDKMKNINWLMGAIVIVLFIGFLTMLLMVVGIVLETWRFKGTTCENLLDEIKGKNSSIGENFYRQDGK